MLYHFSLLQARGISPIPQEQNIGKRIPIKPSQSRRDGMSVEEKYHPKNECRRYGICCYKSLDLKIHPVPTARQQKPGTCFTNIISLRDKAKPQNAVQDIISIILCCNQIREIFPVPEGRNVGKRVSSEPGVP